MAAKKKVAAKKTSAKKRPAPADPMTALALDAWRSTRSPADADAVEAIGASDFAFKTQLAEIAKKSGPLAAAVARMKSVRELEDDPRLTTAIIGWLAEARWDGSGATEGWAVMFERLIALRDGRAVAPLRQMAKELPPFLGAKHRVFMAGEMSRVADALDRVAPPVPANKSIALPHRNSASLLEVVQRVFDAPDDDDLRRVVADELLERGEPWGEFIQLGFLLDEGKAEPDQKRTLEALLKKNSATFAGPLAKISRTQSREFAKGFLKRVVTDASMVPRPAWEAAATTPYWSTVVRVEIDMTSTPKWWLPALVKNAALRRAREFTFNYYSRPEIVVERASESAPWRVVEANNLAEPWLRFLRDFVHALPEAERTRLEVAAIPKRSEILEALIDAR